MGRKLGLRVNPKKFAAANKPCLREFTAFLNCVALNQENENQCSRQKDLMLSCMAEQKKKPKGAWSTINYHLRRLSRL